MEKTVDKYFGNIYLFKNILGCNCVNVDNIKDWMDQERQEQSAE